MNDFRLKVFLSVANNLSFTKAGNELHISQPAISQHIKELENLYNIQLFERTKNTISLTPQGKTFLSYAIEIDSKYQELEFEINIMAQKNSGKLSIGASTTISQYLLPSIIAKYMARFPEIQLSVLSGNSEQIEELLLEHKVDLGIIEGGEHKKEFNYSVFAKDELVLLTSSKNKVKEEVSLDELKALPLVLRENGSGTLAEIIKALKSKNIKNTELNTT
ncbi:MAG: LysR family transcriptional regulator, partial [Bacteroidetes bacterium]|nr:LysR family transcriptional regulator [Bacteroidota bacterium]